MGLLQKIVRNDAVKYDPPEIYNIRVLLISIAVSGYVKDMACDRRT